MKIPCGRNISDKYLNCKRKHHWWNTYWIKNNAGYWELRCLFCHHKLLLTGSTISFKEWLFKKQ